MKRLDGKVVVITGSTRGIGAAIAEACGKAGAQLVICSRSEPTVMAVTKRFREAGYAVTGIPVDVSKFEDLQRLFTHALETWGKIDIWINNAGVSSGYRLLEHIPNDEIKSIVDINVTATLLACKIVIPYFKEQGQGILINVSGRGGSGDYAPFMVPYTATKAAITTLTKSLAAETSGYAISINSVVPGMVKTDFFDHIEASPEGQESLKSLPYVLKAFGVPLDTVGAYFVDVISQPPGKVTGKNYSLLKGARLLRGIAFMIWYKLMGKV